jgi:hypothetical protein
MKKVSDHLNSLVGHPFIGALTASLILAGREDRSMAKLAESPAPEMETLTAPDIKEEKLCWQDAS